MLLVGFESSRAILLLHQQDLHFGLREAGSECGSGSDLAHPPSRTTSLRMACPSDELCTCLPVLTVLVFCRMQLTRSLRERECPRQLTAVTPISVSALYFQRARPFAVSLFQPSCTRRTAASLQVLAADLRGVCAGNARNLPMLSAAPHAFPPPTTPWLPFSVALGGLCLQWLAAAR